jgi:hypothetical protein
MMRATGSPNYINHFVIVIDRSTSMIRHQRAVEQVVDNQVAYWAERSKHWEQETRVTVYTFSDQGSTECLIYDMDVLRVPTIKGRYQPGGMTALLDATCQAIDELMETPTRYGDHAFVVYAVTDGQENDSRLRPFDLDVRIMNHQADLTVGVFVPDQRGLLDAQKAGFPKGNTEIWDTTSATGFEEVGRRMTESTERFFEGRTRGVRSYASGLFQVNAVSASQVVSSLGSLDPGSYSMFEVGAACPIRDFVEEHTGRYVMGRAYYELVKSETIQPQKEVAFVVDGRVYTGRAARDLLGLPDYHVKVQPNHAGGTVFVQSTSVNRKLVRGQRLLVLR